MNENPAFSDRMNRFASRHWFLLFSLAMGIYAGLPFLAPVFMHVGWSSAGNAIYSIYAWLCHQYPQRSFFLFGPRFTYSLVEVQHAWKDTLDPLVLRQFIATAGRVGRRSSWLRENRRFGHETPGTRKRHRLALLVGVQSQVPQGVVQVHRRHAERRKPDEAPQPPRPEQGPREPREEPESYRPNQRDAGVRNPKEGAQAPRHAPPRDSGP